MFMTVTTNNYKTLTNLQTLQTTTAHAKSSRSITSSLLAARQRLLTMEIPLLPC
jgi:hypothetical protein